MDILRAYKYELDPNDRQRTRLVRSAGAARFVFNWGLQQKQQARRQGRKAPNAIALHRQLNALKASHFPWLYDVSKCCGQEALRDLDRAFANFFAKRARYPRFKSRKRGLGGFRLTGSITIQGKYVTLPRLGTLKLKEVSRVEGKILAATVRETAGRWFVSIQVKQSVAVCENQAPAIGVDLGVSHLATLSNGTAFDNPKALQRNLLQLQRVSRRSARRQKGSRRRQRLRRRLARLHFRIACLRADALHKLTTYLARNYGVIGIEDLNVSGMLQNHSLARAISDCSFAEFRRQLTYKCLWQGSRLVVFDRFYPSSKRCSGCGAVKEELPLSERVYRCDVCGLVLDRDVNAARNLLPSESESDRTPVRRLLDVEAATSAGRNPLARKPRQRSVNRARRLLG
jgi:putative transposase